MSLLGPPHAMDGPLWSSNVALARVLAATMPSGCSIIAAIRDELGSIITGPRSSPTIPPGWCTPVVHFDNVTRPWPPNYIYVGHGPRGSEVNPSPLGITLSHV